MKKHIKKSIRRFVRRMVQSKKYRIWVGKLAVSGAVLFLGIPLILSLLLSNPVKAGGEDDNVLYKYFHMIEIEAGDTLWEIAKENYDPSSQTIKEYIAEVMNINHLYGTEIYAGERIMIPYYSAELK